MKICPSRLHPGKSAGNNELKNRQFDRVTAPA
jgi:hypothetical protein